MQGVFKHNSKNLRNSSRLLIVDDDVYLRKSLRRQFVTEGFHNIFDMGSVTGLNAAIKDANPDLILLNIQMPDGNGVDICKYKADFRYFTVRQENNEQYYNSKGEWQTPTLTGDPEGQIVEDVKGYKTPLYRLKKKLVEASYPGTLIREL